MDRRFLERSSPIMVQPLLRRIMEWRPVPQHKSKTVLSFDSTLWMKSVSLVVSRSLTITSQSAPMSSKMFSYRCCSSEFSLTNGRPHNFEKHLFSDIRLRWESLGLNRPKSHNVYAVLGSTNFVAHIIQIAAIKPPTISNEAKNTAWFCHVKKLSAQKLL